MGENQDRPVVVGIGELLWDMLPAGRQLGGAPTNFAYHARAVGARALVASCVGDDEPGRQILDRLDELNMDRRHIAVDPHHPTGTVDVTMDSAGVPTFIIRTEVAWDFIPVTDELLELAGQAEAVCFGSLAQRSETSRQTIQAFVRATGGGCLRIFDINLRQSFFTREIVHDSLELCDVLKLNDGELPVLAGLLELGQTDEQIVSELMSRYPLRLVALTLGGSGSRLYSTGGRLYEHPGFPARVVDTVGAGDAFTAALAVGLLRGLDLGRINQNANRLASYVCSQSGATPPIPDDLFDEPSHDPA